MMRKGKQLNTILKSYDAQKCFLAMPFNQNLFPLGC